MQRKLSEFGFIEQIANKWQGVVPDGIEGIGDDCAIISKKGGISTVISCDMLVEGVHFLRTMSMEEIGQRAVQVNLSDIAAMGAKPTAMLMAVAIPQDLGDEDMERLMVGVHRCGVPLVGGDTTQSKRGLTVSITIWGEAPNENIKRRRDAKVGELIMVSGKLGAAAVSNYTNPVKARSELGEWLGTRKEVGAMMDISDGVAGDIKHILKQSKVGADIYLDKIPLAPGATIEQALEGGEDYELLFTINPTELKNLTPPNTTLYNIGVITPNAPKIQYFKSTSPHHLELNGFTHF